MTQTGYYETSENLWEHGEIPKCNICGDRACWDTPTSGVQLCEKTTCARQYIEQECDFIRLVDDGKAPCELCGEPVAPISEGEFKGEYICPVDVESMSMENNFQTKKRRKK